MPRLTWDWAPFFAELERIRHEAMAPRVRIVRVTGRKPVHDLAALKRCLLDEVARDGSRSVMQLAAVLGVSYSLTYALLAQLKDDGFVDMRDRKRYSIRDGTAA